MSSRRTRRQRALGRDAARCRPHQNASGLRKALGTDTLVTRAPGYVLRADPSRIDLERFLRQQRLSASPHSGAPSCCGALELWRGTTRRFPLRDVGCDGGDAARRAPTRDGRGADRRRARARPPRRPRGRARSARRAASAARAAMRPADAGALPVGAAGRGTRGVPGHPPGARRRARDRARPCTPAAQRRDPAPGGLDRAGGRRGSCGRPLRRGH